MSADDGLGGDDKTFKDCALKYGSGLRQDGLFGGEAPPDPSLNTPHTITVAAPLLRPGLTISATCSEKYVPVVAKRLLDMAREINKTPAERQRELRDLLEGRSS